MYDVCYSWGVKLPWPEGASTGQLGSRRRDGLFLNSEVGTRLVGQARLAGHRQRQSSS